MKTYAFLTLIASLTVFIGIVAAIETQRKPKQEKIYVLPLVEDMASAPNPLQF